MITPARLSGGASNDCVSDALLGAVRVALDDPQIDALVLADLSLVSAEGLHISGAVAAYGPLRDLASLIETAKKPVVCALSGTLRDGAFELALACHARVADGAARFSMGGIRLGMIPGAGATQRLPRLIGAAGALEILLTGRVFNARAPVIAPLAAQWVEGDPIPAALALARLYAQRGHWPRTGESAQGFSDPAAYRRAIEAAAGPSRSPAARDILCSVEAAQLLPMAQGMAFEETLFDERLAAVETRALRHLARARDLAMPLDAAATRGKIEKVVVIGAEGESARAAALALGAGCHVQVLVPDRARLQAGTHDLLHVIRASHARQTDTQIGSMLARLQITSSSAPLREADLVLDGGQGTLRRDVPVHAGALWAALTPEIAPTRVTLAPGRFLWLHLHGEDAPVTIAEWAAQDAYEPDALAGLRSLFRVAGAVLLPTGRPPAGSLGQRLDGALGAASCVLVSHGASPYEVDRAARQIGLITGPFLRIDRQGMRAAVHRIGQYAELHGGIEIDLSLLLALADKGRFGRACARGIYAYPADGPQTDPGMGALIADLAQGHEAAKWGMDTLSTALLAALVGEGARLLSEGVARHAGDLDLLMVHAMGFAPTRGGALFQGDLVGVLALVRQMKTLEQLSPLWTPPALLLEMIKNGRGFVATPAG